jgi:hypothetical protein
MNPGRPGDPADHGETMEKSRSSGFAAAAPNQHEMVNFP